MTIPTQPPIDLSISIVNTNNWAFLKPCLDSIYENVKGISFEVLVVDNASTDDSADKIKEHFPQVVMSVNTTRFGFAKNNNINLYRASGRYLMLLNDDTLMIPGTLEKAVQFLDQHPEIGALGCEMVSPDGEYQVASARKIRTLRSEFLIETGINRRVNYINPLPKVGEDCVGIELPSEAGMIVRREVYEQVGPLDEQFFMCGEGADWCYRIKQAKWKIVFLPGTKIVHYGGQTLNRIKLKTYLQFYKSTYLFLNKENEMKGMIYRFFILTIFSIKRFVANFRSFFEKPNAKVEAHEKIKYYDALLDLFSHRIHEANYPLPDFDKV